MLRQIIEFQFGPGHAECVGMANREQKPEISSGKAGSGSMPTNLAAIFTTEGRENLSPAFEAWLRAYRTRLEQACNNSPAQSAEKFDR